MKILLIEANIPKTAVSPCLGLACLKGYLHQKTSHRARILDLTFAGNRWKTVVSEAIRSESPDAVGISFLISNYGFAKDIARFVKKASSLPVLMGGAFVILSPEEVIRNPDVDILCTGEGEETLAALLDNRLDGQGVAGIWYRRHGAIIRNEKRPLTADIDCLGFPDFEDFDLAKYFLLSGNALPMMASRGCPYRCSYCCNRAISQSLSGKYVRTRSVDSVIAEIALRLETLKGKGLEYLLFYDPTFILNQRFVRQFCARFIERGFHRRLKWSANVRAELVTDEIIRIMRDAGCLEVRMAVESGNDHIRNAVYKRNQSKAQIRQAARIIRGSGLLLRTYYLLGAPCETVETAEESLAFARELKADQAIFFSLIPLPGSEIHGLCAEAGLLPTRGRRLGRHDIGGAVEQTRFVSRRQMRKLVRRVQRWQLRTGLKQGYRLRGLAFFKDLGLVLFYLRRKHGVDVDLYRSTVYRYQIQDLARKIDARSAG